MSTSVPVRSSANRSTPAGNKLPAILAAGAVCAVVAAEARAVNVRNETTNAVVFNDDFESGDFLSPSPGSWSNGPEVTVTSSTTPPNPGPFQGTFYGRSFRDDPNTNSEGNMRANLSAAQSTAGDVIHLTAMLYIPNDGFPSRAFFALSDGNVVNDGRAIVRTDGAGNVIAVVGGLASQDSGLDYTPDAWQLWELEYAVGGSTFNVRVNGVSAGPFTSFTTGQVDTAEMFNGNSNAGAFSSTPCPSPPRRRCFCVAAPVVALRRPTSRRR